MASVPLDFIPPSDPNIAALRIYEAPAQSGPFTMIERTTLIGTAPNYITRYTTDLAVSSTGWFAIAWEDDSGLVGEMSQAIQGGTSTLVQRLIDRVALRDASLDERIVAQEAEAVISDYFGVLDPYTIDPATVSPKIMSGLTMLAMARSMIARTLTTTASSADKWTAGIVSMDKSTSSGSSSNVADTIEKLLDLANKQLGRNYSVILLMEEIAVADGRYAQLVAADLSRSIIEVQ